MVFSVFLAIIHSNDVKNCNEFVFIMCDNEYIKSYTNMEKYGGAVLKSSRSFEGYCWK